MVRSRPRPLFTSPHIDLNTALSLPIPFEPHISSQKWRLRHGQWIANGMTFRSRYFKDTLGFLLAKWASRAGRTRTWDSHFPTFFRKYIYRDRPLTFLSPQPRGNFSADVASKQPSGKQTRALRLLLRSSEPSWIYKTWFPVIRYI